MSCSIRSRKSFRQKRRDFGKVIGETEKFYAAVDNATNYNTHTI